MRHHVLAANLIDPGWWSGTVGYSRTSHPSLASLQQKRHRTRQKLNLLTTLLLSQGAPMLLVGDEMKRT